MQAERWLRVEELFFEALDHEPEERASLLRDACRGEEELRSEVASLLAVHERARHLTCVSEIAAPPAPGGAGVGSRVGTYRILGELGHGGMGRVYLAVRDDREFERLVAIKLLPLTASSGDRLGRFSAEKKILAQLDHPNIAALLDAGVTEDGESYFVMEYVPGRPIDRYCEERELGIGERLGLFRQVCEAVAHAHRNLVVHRDLKPSNLLVTDSGVPKLLDFGIAKLLESDMVDLTRTAGERPMTPGYASPEQLLGEPITTASDIYSLGVVLYRLLTHQHPVDGSLTGRMKQVIAEADPEPPSQAVLRSDGARPQTRQRRLSRKLAGELDAIVLKALQPNPAGRYSTIDQLVHDLDCYRAGLPITAQRLSLARRAVKFARRNKLVVGAAALVLLLVAAFLYTARAQARNVARERDKAQKVAAFLVDLFEVSRFDEPVGSSVSARELLAQGARRVVGLQADPDIRATMLDTIGSIYSNLGMQDEARPLLEQSLEIRREHFGDRHPDVADSFEHLAQLALGEGELEEATEHVARALALRRRLLGEDHPAYADGLALEAQILERHTGDLPAVERLYGQVLAIRERALGEESREVAATLEDLAAILLLQARVDEAEPLLRRALEIQRKALGPLHPATADTLYQLGALHRRRADFAAAEAYYREAVELRRQFLPPDHPAIAAALNGLSISLQEGGKTMEAFEVQREATAIYRAIHQQDHPELATAINNLGVWTVTNGDPEQAEALLVEALEMRERILEPGHFHLHQSRFTLGRLYRRTGRLDEAERLLRRVVQETAGQRHIPEVALPRLELAALLTETGRAAEAEPLARAGFTALSGKLPAGHRRLVAAREVLRQCLIALGREDEAAALAPAPGPGGEPDAAPGLGADR